MNTNKAKQFIIANARPFELSLYRNLLTRALQ